MRYRIPSSVSISWPKYNTYRPASLPKRGVVRRSFSSLRKCLAFSKTHCWLCLIGKDSIVHFALFQTVYASDHRIQCITNGNIRFEKPLFSVFHFPFFFLLLKMAPFLDLRFCFFQQLQWNVLTFLPFHFPSTLTLPMPKGRRFLLPAAQQQLASVFLPGRSAGYGCAITRRRAEPIVPYAVCLIFLSPTYSVEPQMFIAPSTSL